MTEYDYSPGAREAYEKKLQGVGRWAKKASRSKLVDPFNSRLSTAGTVDLSYEGPDRPPSPGTIPQKAQKPPPPALAQHKVYGANDRRQSPVVAQKVPKSLPPPPVPVPVQHQVYGAQHYHSNVSVAAPECYRYAQRGGAQGVEVPPFPIPPKHTHGPPPSRSRSRQHLHGSSTSLHTRYQQPHQQPHQSSRHHHKPHRQVVDNNSPKKKKPQLYIQIPPVATPIIPGVNVPALYHLQPQQPPPQVYRQAKAAHSQPALYHPQPQRPPPPPRVYHQARATTHSQPFVNINSPVVYGQAVLVAPKKTFISRFTSIFKGGTKERATSGGSGEKKKHRGHHRDRCNSF